MKKIAFSVMITIALSFASFQHVFAIGMMTQPIVINDILRGQETLVTLTLLNSEDKEVTYGLKGEGQIEKWLSFYKIDDKDFKNPITEIKIPNKKFLDVTAKFSVPKDMPNGKYTGKILVFLTSSKEVKDDKSVNVSQQVSRDVTITVTDKEIVQLKASFIPASYDVLQGKPLSIRVLYDNQGNIAVSPDVRIKITKSGATVYNVIFPYPDGEVPVGAYTKKEITKIEWQTVGQDNGDYQVELAVFVNGNEVQSESFDFSIGHANVGSPAALSYFGGGNKAIILWFSVGAIGVVLVTTFIILHKKRMALIKKRAAAAKRRKRKEIAKEVTEKVPEAATTTVE